MNEKIRILRQFDLDAVELMYARTDEFEPLSDDNVEYLRSLPYVSVHAPFWHPDKSRFYYEDHLAEEVVKKMRDIYDLVQARSIVFHPDRILDYCFMDEGMNISIENMPDRYGDAVEYLSDIFTGHEYSMLLDTAHAFSFSVDYLAQLVETFRDRIEHVHLSDRRDVAGVEKDHRLVHDCDDMSRFDPIVTLTCPFIIEVALREDEPLSLLEKELRFVRSYFC